MVSGSCSSKELPKVQSVSLVTDFNPNSKDLGPQIPDKVHIFSELGSCALGLALILSHAAQQLTYQRWSQIAPDGVQFCHIQQVIKHT